MRLSQVLDEAGISYCNAGEHHHVSEGWIGIDCPWCPPPRGNKGRFRLGINLETGKANCWVCGGKSLKAVLLKAGRISPKAVDSLLAGVTIQRVSHVEHTGHFKPPTGIGPLQPAHKKYLKSRGFDPKQIEKLWNVQGIGIASRLQWRLFVPIMLDGRQVSWTTRAIGNRTPKYKNAPSDQESVSIKDTLYGIDLVRTTIIVCEGPTDVWRIGPGAVATFGVNVTPSQIDIIRRFPIRVLCFDSDVNKNRSVRSLAEALGMFNGETYQVELDAEDPASASTKEIRQLRKAFVD